MILPSRRASRRRMARRGPVSLKDEITDLENVLADVVLMSDGLLVRQWGDDEAKTVMKRCSSIQSLVVGRLQLLRAAIGGRATFDLLATSHNEALAMSEHDHPDVVLSDRPPKKASRAGSWAGKVRPSTAVPRGR